MTICSHTLLFDYKWNNKEEASWKNYLYVGRIIRALTQEEGIVLALGKLFALMMGLSGPKLGMLCISKLQNSLPQLWHQ